MTNTGAFQPNFLKYWASNALVSIPITTKKKSGKIKIKKNIFLNSIARKTSTKERVFFVFLKKIAIL
ncbi:MAG TPA: hypothetical protein DCS28_03850 [Candidatus Moranbacteria bacterium]|nr:hypothetical protein [Candidatus Moranbacteria bacterium]HAT75145.1 hypothetical protein [Candidatus Moranbacteria bacterium]